ncbi:MAG: type II toxin-antitoxin system HicB family antitoxin [Oscillospiraceae bacterium]|nr:type II toxin-antitoxin system HicB family antitoxin [Oscillospiraceae bacterium]
MAKYIYPAIFEQSETGSGYFVSFPDVESAFTSGKNLMEAMELATDVLGTMLYTHETDEDEPILPPTPINEIKAPKNGFTTYVLCDTDVYRNAYTRATVSSPRVSQITSRASLPLEQIYKIVPTISMTPRNFEWDELFRPLIWSEVYRPPEPPVITFIVEPSDSEKIHVSEITKGKASD